MEGGVEKGSAQAKVRCKKEKGDRREERRKKRRDK